MGSTEWGSEEGEAGTGRERRKGLPCRRARTSRAEARSPPPCRKARRGGAHAKETPPCRPLSVCQNPSLGEGCRPPLRLTLCPAGPRVGHTTPTGPSHALLGRTAGPASVINSGRDDQKPFLGLMFKHGEKHSPALEAVKLEGMQLELEPPASPPCSPPACLRIMPRRSRTFREDMEPSSAI